MAGKVDREALETAVEISKLLCDACSYGEQAAAAAEAYLLLLLKQAKDSEEDTGSDAQ